MGEAVTAVTDDVAAEEAHGDVAAVTPEEADVEVHGEVAAGTCRLLARELSILSQLVPSPSAPQVTADHAAAAHAAASAREPPGSSSSSSSSSSIPVPVPVMGEARGDTWATGDASAARGVARYGAGSKAQGGAMGAPTGLLALAGEQARRVSEQLRERLGRFTDGL